MKKTMLAFAAVIAAAASVAGAEGTPYTGLDHSNDSGEIIGLKEVQYQGVKLAAKEDDRVKFVYESNEPSKEGNSYRSLGRQESR
ncbi:hypothetical protein [Neisseria dentiae]|uniref:hypothetical protein n=1 Tax=Neisseria dentiae TaxID=194197 RepID=UPI00211C31D5|nr:hypothetical protein [Neisseria dentiae]MCQ9327389.1 hypothetical protein [Neisseria dentiae]